MKMLPAFFSVVWLFAPLLSAAEPEPKFNPQQLEFFENKVRPILAEHCQECHGPREQEAGLRLDSRSLVIRGGDSGPAIVAGKPEQSLLVRAIRYANEPQMPPDGKLAKEQIDTLIQWIAMGAPWPVAEPQQAVAKGPSHTSPEGIARVRAEHWSFRPVKPPHVPKLPHAGPSPVDRFVQARLDAAGLKMAPPADRRTLIRRAYFNLIGLPPTREEVRAFEADTSPDAFAKVVDKLLDNPQYGERWGRHWLDVARYSDTKGYVFQEERRYPFSYTFREYVIRSFNEDKPYDQFLREQLAADQLELGDDKRPLAALGYLTLGRRFLNNQQDIIDDRIDVVMRGMQAMTVGCARCHDHKYDPIPTADYYSLYGVFASCTEPDELPLIEQPGDSPRSEAYEKEVAKRRAAHQQALDKARGELKQKLYADIGKYLLAVKELQGFEDRRLRDAARERGLHSVLVDRWRDSIAARLKSGHDPVFSPLVALAALKDGEFAAQAPQVLARMKQDPKRPVHPGVHRVLSDPPLKSFAEAAERFGKLLGETQTAWQQLRKQDKNAQALPEPDQESLRLVLAGPTGVLAFPDELLDRGFDRPTRNKLRELEKKIVAYQATAPGAPRRAMVLVDRDRPVEPRILRRGNPRSPGDRVPRQFLAAVAGEKRQPFQQGSGRLELAHAIGSKDNPLTARVIVNRVWMHHFGEGLVTTPSDFGTRSDPPSHPELLDWLSWQLMEEGWSLKSLHRRIMLSRTFQQSSEPAPGVAERDPDNRLLSHFNRRRLDFEAMRDSLLAVAGRLDATMGGRSVDLVKQPYTTRRTVYGYIDRQNLEPLLRTFDFASPDTTNPQRYTTTVPQQALFMLNNPFVVEQAQHLAKRPAVTDAKPPAERVRRIYQLVYGRDPQPDEARLALNFITNESAPDKLAGRPAVWQYGYGEFDDGQGRLKQFHPLPHFTGQAWQGGGKLPDVKLGWVMLNAGGGHVGNDQQHAAVRRWMAPRDGVVQIRGQLKHARPEGDGVRARIGSSRAGKLGQWVAHNQEQTTHVDKLEVKRGDTLDFVVDCRGSVSHDSFTWAPVIKLAGADGGTQEWNAASNFGGSKSTERLTPWEKLAQVLLLSNEFVFVD